MRLDFLAGSFRSPGGYPVSERVYNTGEGSMLVPPGGYPVSERVYNTGSRNRLALLGGHPVWNGCVTSAGGVCWFLLVATPS